jgi:ATP-dependent Lhr-like helicase
MRLAWQELSDERLKNYLESLGIKTKTEIQRLAIKPILKGENVLLIAPTGSGKTEAAIIPLVDRLLKNGKSNGISILYITPLRALNRDMLLRLERLCRLLGLKVEVRHGDTPSKERRRQSSNPPDLLVTTPETLQAILPGKKMRENLRNVNAVIVDELHNIVESKRGTQLTVGLERLRKLAGNFQVVALSATIGSPDVASSFIFGRRGGKIIVSDELKRYRYSVCYPVPSEEDSKFLDFAPPELNSRLSFISKMIDTHNSTLIFVNSRTIAEMLGEKLGRIRRDVGVHHGSLPREERESVERAFKKGELKALVCTSTLELGIDIGSVDLVIHYMSPRQVTALIQRTGRSGHSLGRTSEGIIVAVSPDDALEAAASIRLASKREIEPTKIYSNSLDVLSHQIAGYILENGDTEFREILDTFRDAYPFTNLDEQSMLNVLNFLAELRRLKFERNIISKTGKTREYYFENLSMIPDEIRYIVVDVTTNQSVGILGDEFVLLRVRNGIHFILKGRVWQVEKVTEDRKVYVTPVDDPLAALPGWEGEMAPVHYILATETGRLREELASLISQGKVELADETLKQLNCDENSRSFIIDEIAEQIKMNAPIPSHRVILVEGFGKYLIVHSCFGEAVNRAFGFSFEEILSRKGLVRLWWMDGYRILFELTEETKEIGIENIARMLFSIKPEELDSYYRVAVKRNFPFPERIKNIAMRFGALRRGMYISHPNLCSLPTRFENTPIYTEAVQETEKDLVDMDKAKEIIGKVNSSLIEVKAYQCETKPTPIAYHILYKYLDVPEAVAPESLSKTIHARMKVTIEATKVNMVCMKCANSSGFMMVGMLEEEPKCKICSSMLLCPCFYDPNRILELLKAMSSGSELKREERLELSKARRAADLVLAYGRKAVYALSVYGIGPQTASRILSEMHENEEEFYRALLDAKLRFVSTRAFWKD